ncbi:MAG: hypothetical protein ACRD96_00880 [Bryobacteraceae bacterium]
MLIAAYRGIPAKREPLLAILNDRSRSFIASPFLYMETMPMAIFHKKADEIEFYRTYFDRVRWIDNVESIVEVARIESEWCGHAEKPIHRTSLVQVVSLYERGAK